MKDCDLCWPFECNGTHAALQPPPCEHQRKLWGISRGLIIVRCQDCAAVICPGCLQPIPQPISASEDQPTTKTPADDGAPKDT